MHTYSHICGIHTFIVDTHKHVPLCILNGKYMHKYMYVLVYMYVQLESAVDKNHKYYVDKQSKQMKVIIIDNSLYVTY